MKCTGKGISVFSVLVFSCVLLTGCQSENTVAKYEAENYNNNLYEGHLYAEDLCVSKDDVEIEDDYPWFELNVWDFKDSTKPPQIDKSPEEVVGLFLAAKDHWEE